MPNSRRAAAEHGVVLAAYALLAIGLSWPTAAGFTTQLTGAGLDALHHLWSVWHTVEALAGRDPFFETRLLYYPTGVSLLLHSAGPVAGVMALPAWWLGPVAGYNGGLLLGLTLTGWCTYLLARGTGLDRPHAFLAGTIVLAAPIHLVGLRGHLAKVFVGLPAVALLTLTRALDARRTAWWAAACGASLLLVLLHNALLFQLTLMAAACLAGWTLLRVRDARRAVVARLALVVPAIAAATGPLVVASARAAANPAVRFDRHLEAIQHQPDLVQFVLPPTFGRVFGGWTHAILARFGLSATIETEVAVPWTVLAGCVAAIAWRERRARPWLAIGGAAMILALGPTLQVLGRQRFTAFGFSIPLPFDWIVGLPGLGYLRTPGRFMLLGFLGLALAAAWGISATATRAPRWRRTIVVAATIVLLVECWPTPWPTQTLEPVPSFVRQLADEAGSFGVIDLPVRPVPEASAVEYSARYQVLQMTHRKGIAGGYLSRVYERHPLAPCLFAPIRALDDVRVDGAPSDCGPAALVALGRHGYRYVVWHDGDRAETADGDQTWVRRDTRNLVDAAFGGRPPDQEDGRTKVWRLDSGARSWPARPALSLGAGWYDAEASWRWASSPATLHVVSGAERAATLIVLPHYLGNPAGPAGGQTGVLALDGPGVSLRLPATAGTPARFPIVIGPGPRTLTLSLESGTFRPIEAGSTDARLLSFAVRWIELDTSPRPVP